MPTFNDFVQTELPLRPFVSTDGLPGQKLVRSGNPLAPREMVWADDTATGPVHLKLISNGPISGHRVVTVDSAGKAIYADNEIFLHATSIVGISLNAAVDGGEVSIAKTGEEVQEASWTWIVGEPVYLGTNGVLVQSVPVAPALFSLSIGFAIGTDRLFVNVGVPIFF